VRAPDASLLACSYDEVVNRRDRRGAHAVPIVSAVTAAAISQAYLNGTMAGRVGELETAIDLAATDQHVHWVPDGDAAFDDGSYVLQFDVVDQVRLIAFRNVDYRATDVREAWLDGDAFYGLLASWVANFDRDWELRSKH